MQPSGYLSPRLEALDPNFVFLSIASLVPELVRSRDADVCRVMRRVRLVLVGQCRHHRLCAGSGVNSVERLTTRPGRFENADSGIEPEVIRVLSPGCERVPAFGFARFLDHHL